MRDHLKESGFVPSFRNLRGSTQSPQESGECGTLLRGPVLSRHFETRGIRGSGVWFAWSDDGTSLRQTNVSRHFETCTRWSAGGRPSPMIYIIV